MDRLQRVVFLAILSLTLYAGFMWIEKGAIIFPFPLNDIIFFIVTIIAIILEPKPVKFPIAFGGIALFSLMTNEFLYSTILSQEQQLQLYETTFIDICFIFKTVFIIIAGITLIQNKQQYINYFLLFLLIILSSYFIIAFEIPILLMYIPLLILGLINNLKNPYNHLINLLLFLELSKLLTVYLNSPSI